LRANDNVIVALSSQHFANAKSFAMRGNFSSKARCRRAHHFNLTAQRPCARVPEYEACLSYAQSTIIFRAMGFARQVFAAFALPQGMGDGIRL
jgi:hypothetical protein